MIADCLEFLRKKDRLGGIAVFCYRYLYDPLTGEPNGALSAELENLLPVWAEM